MSGEARFATPATWRALRYLRNDDTPCGARIAASPLQCRSTAQAPRHLWLETLCGTCAFFSANVRSHRGNPRIRQEPCAFYSSCAHFARARARPVPTRPLVGLHKARRTRHGHSTVVQQALAPVRRARRACHSKPIGPADFTQGEKNARGTIRYPGACLPNAAQGAKDVPQ